MWVSHTSKAFLVTFGAFPKVTRCQSGTLSRRYRDNGYVPIFRALPWRQERFAYRRVT